MEMRQAIAEAVKTCLHEQAAQPAFDGSGDRPTDPVEAVLSSSEEEEEAGMVEEDLHSTFLDPGACHVDAFTMPWDNDFYACPPFSLVNRCLEKIQQDAVRGILIVPDWATQPWLPVMLHLLKRQLMKIPVHERSLHLPFKSDARHPLVGKLTLLVCLVSGN
jgi:hypothetical protein